MQCTHVALAWDKFLMACTTPPWLCKALCYGKCFGQFFFKPWQNLGAASYMCLTHLQPWRFGGGGEKVWNTLLKHITVFLICRKWNKRGIRMKRKMSEKRKELSFDSGLTHASSTDVYTFKTQMHTAFRPPFLLSSQISWSGGCYAFQMRFSHCCQL